METNMMTKPFCVFSVCVFVIVTKIKIMTCFLLIDLFGLNIEVTLKIYLFNGIGEVLF